jgi:cobalt-zinc-cadmium efflux system outer membrane protein
MFPSFFCVLFLFFFKSIAVAQSAQFANAEGSASVVAAPLVLTIKQAVDEALQRNLSLLAERANITIAEANLITAQLRPNPVLSLSADHQDFLGTGFSRNNGAGPPEFSLRIDVPIERGGKRELRTETATLGKQVVEIQLLDSMRKLALDVALACVDVLQAKASVALATDNLHTLTEVVRLNEVKVRDGAIAPVELTRSQVAMLQYRGNVKRAELDLLTAKTKLQYLLGRSETGGEIDLQGELKAPLGAADFQFAALEEQAFVMRPDVRALEQSQARSQADLKLQLAQAKVDYTWGVEYRRQQGVSGKGDTMGLFFSAPLPLFSRNQGEIARALAEGEQFAKQLQALKAQVCTEVKVAAQEFQTARELVESIERDLLHPAEQARDTVAYTYRAGASSLVEFLDAQRAFNDTMQGYYEAQGTYRRALMKLNVAVGKEVAS